jgi:hypothetical protein
MLQAESDRDIVRRFDSIRAKEKELGEDFGGGLKVGVPGIG